MKREQSEPSIIPSENKEKPLESASAVVVNDPLHNQVLDKVTAMDYALGDFICGICQKEMSKSVKVLCADCGTQLCLECFANGKEKDPHRRGHDYYVLDRLKFPLFEPDWTAYEELTLMKGIEKFGVDNWVEIGDFLGSKSAAACETHYYAFYYRSQTQKIPTSELVVSERLPDGTCKTNEERLTKAKELVKISREKQIERGSKPEDCVVPASKEEQKAVAPEPAPGDVIGYMPLRGDFNVEYDNDAELILADMEFCEDDKKSDVDLKYEVLKLYNSKLDERVRRKKFIIDKGLVDVKSILQQEQKLSKDEREAYALLRPFLRFCSGDEYKRLAEGLLQEVYLRQRLEELQHFKALGLTTFADIEKHLQGKHPVEADSSSLMQKGNKGDQSPSQSQHEANSSPKKEPAVALLESTAKQENDSMDLDANKNAASEAEESKVLVSKNGNNNEEAESKPHKEEPSPPAGEEEGKAAEFAGLDENERTFCEELELPPKAYLAFKEKLQQKAAKSRNALRKVTALEFMDKIIGKNKALAIFDFLSSNNMLSKSEQAKIR